MIEKEEIKLSWFTDDITAYAEKLKELTKNKKTLLEPISNVSGYKVNTPKKPIAFLYTSMKK